MQVWPCNFKLIYVLLWGLPRWFSGKEPACQRRHRKWQPTPVFLPGKSHGLRSLKHYSPRAHKESNMTEWLNKNNSTAEQQLFNSSLKYFSLKIYINWFWYRNNTFFYAWTATVHSQPMRASLTYSTVTFALWVSPSFYDLSQGGLYHIILNHVVWSYSVNGFFLLFILCAVWTHSDLQRCVFDCSRNATKKQRNRITLNVKIQVFWWFLAPSKMPVLWWFLSSTRGKIKKQMKMGKSPQVSL